MGSIYVICSRQCPNGDGIYTLLYALYKYSTSITNQPTNWILLPGIQMILNHRWFRWRLGTWKAGKSLVLGKSDGCRLNTLRPRQNGRHFADDIFKYIFLNENIWISIKISLKFVPKGPINNIPALVQIMACRRPGDKPLSELIMASFLTHICVTRPQWVITINGDTLPRKTYWNVFIV